MLEPVGLGPSLLGSLLSPKAGKMFDGLQLMSKKKQLEARQLTLDASQSLPMTAVALTGKTVFDKMRRVVP